jgi:hypothetical protein
MAWGRPLIAIAAVFAVWRLNKLGRVPNGFWVILATALAFWLLAGFNEKDGRPPDASRYMHVGAIFLLLMAAELLAGVKIRRNVLAVIAVLAGVAIVSNASFLWQARNSYLRTSELEQAGLTAVELARDTVDPSFMLAPDLVDTGYVYVSAERYLSALDAYGHSPAYSEDELIAAPAPARDAADKTLAAALRLGFTPDAGVSGGNCVQPAGPLEGVDVPAGGAWIDNPTDRPADVKLRRYADGYRINVATLAPHTSGAFAIPADRGTAPWQLAVADGSSTVRVCALGDA